MPCDLLCDRDGPIGACGGADGPDAYPCCSDDRAAR